MFKQLRAKLSGFGDGSEQTPQDKSGTKKAQNWLGRQLSGRRSPNDSSSDGEFETVIAASAFAVTSAEEVDSPKQKKAPAETRQTSLSKGKSSKEDKMSGPPDARKASRGITGEISMKKPEAADQKPTDSAFPSKQMPEKIMGVVPIVKRTPTFSGTGPDDKAIVKSESGKGTIPKRSVSFKEEPTTPIRDQNGTSNDKAKKHGTGKKADIWEKEQMAKIQKRYEKLKSTILSWEHEKQTKARRRLERKERDLEMKRARAQQEHRNEMARINKLAAGARVSAEERKRNDEVQTKEKAKKIRKTGKMPVTCLCF